MKRRLRFLALCAASLMIVGLLAACSPAAPSESNATKAPDTATEAPKDTAGEAKDTAEPAAQDPAAATLDTSKQVALSMYVCGDPPNKWSEQEENFNKICLERFNATLKVNWLSWAEYQNKYPLLFSSGEEFDMAYAATWLNFAALAQRGAFMPLDELWPQYAPRNYARQSETALFQATVSGKKYCIPTLLATYSAYGPIYRLDLAEAKGWEAGREIKSFKDMEEYLQLIKDSYPEMEPYTVMQSGSELDDLYMYNNDMYPIKGSTGDFLWLDPKEESPKLQTYYEYQKTPEFLAMVSDWNNRGFWPKSALSDTDSEKFRNGKTALRIHNIDSYEGDYREYEYKAIQGNPWKIGWYNFVSDVSNMAFTQDALVIANTSKNPERALMVYDAITNEEDVFRAFFYGIEGKSYELQEVEGTTYVTPIGTENQDYAFSNCWAARTVEFLLPTIGQPADLKEWKTSFDNYIQDGKMSQKYRSLAIDTSSVETEYAACQNAHQQYWWPLELGFVDPVAGLAEYSEKMKAAGIEKVQEVLQKQLDDYLASVK